MSDATLIELLASRLHEAENTRTPIDPVRDAIAGGDVALDLKKRAELMPQ